MNITRKFLLISLISLILTSCSLSDLISDFTQRFESIDSSEETLGYFHSEDSGNSLQLINNAFNGKIDINNNSLLDDFSNITTSKNNRINLNTNVTLLEYNEYSTPSIGKVKGLVIPVDFPDYPIKDTNYESILPTYQSVSSYYYNSSYGKLDIEFDVLDWYRLSHQSSYYAKLNNKEYIGDAPGVSAIIREVLLSADSQINFKDYDSNNDGVIDCLHIIYNHPIDRRYADFWWAYQYCNFNTNYTYDKMIPYSYVFAGFDFLFDNDEECNTRTYIHETGHLFGLEDYYDYDTSKGFNHGGLGGYDMMDTSIGEHNPFSKIALGWINNPIFPSYDENGVCKITLDSYEKYGDTILVPFKNFDASKEMFQSYYLIQLLNPDSRLLNNEYNKVTSLGIRIYEVNAQLTEYIDDNNRKYLYYEYDNSYTSKNVINAINNRLFDPYYTKKEYDYVCASNKDFFHSKNRYTLPNNNVEIYIENIDSKNLNCTIKLTKK